MLTIPERLGDQSELLRKLLGKFSSDLRVCLPRETNLYHTACYPGEA